MFTEAMRGEVQTQSQTRAQRASYLYASIMSSSSDKVARNPLADLKISLSSESCICATFLYLARCIPLSFGASLFLENKN